MEEDIGVNVPEYKEKVIALLKEGKTGTNHDFCRMLDEEDPFLVEVLLINLVEEDYMEQTGYEPFRGLDGSQKFMGVYGPGPKLKNS